ncbi:MAG: hypothetical protein ABSC14_05810, partial [Desulfomonilia bacterium]
MAVKDWTRDAIQRNRTIGGSPVGEDRRPGKRGPQPVETHGKCRRVGIGELQNQGADRNTVGGEHCLPVYQVGRGLDATGEGRGIGKLGRT